jgi:hypothetical protein
MLDLLRSILAADPILARFAHLQPDHGELSLWREQVGGEFGWDGLKTPLSAVFWNQRLGDIVRQVFEK